MQKTEEQPPRPSAPMPKTEHDEKPRVPPPPAAYDQANVDAQRAMHQNPDLKETVNEINEEHRQETLEVVKQDEETKKHVEKISEKAGTRPKAPTSLSQLRLPSRRNQQINDVAPGEAF